MTSDLERSLMFQVKAHKLPTPVTELRFAPPRRFRFDLAWPAHDIAAECEGGTWVSGAHSRGKHFESDCVKYNLATLNGWKVYRFTTNMISDGRAIATLLDAFEAHRKEAS